MAVDVYYQAGLPSRFWPYATQALCDGINTVVKNGESCYNKSHKNGHFQGKYIPFGCLVDYYHTKRTCARKSAGSKDIPDEDKEDDLDDEEEENVDAVDQDEKREHVEKFLAHDIDHGFIGLRKFSPRGVPGIFLGHRVSPGGCLEGRLEGRLFCV